MLHIIGKIIELSAINDGKDLIEASLKYAKEYDDTISPGARMIFSIFSRTVMMKAKFHTYGQVHQLQLA